MSVRVYFSSVSGNKEIKKDQQRLFMILQSKHISFKGVDVCASAKDLEDMREMMGNPTALPPQIFNGDDYCGDITAFEEAVEAEDLQRFLKL